MEAEKKAAEREKKLEDKLKLQDMGDDERLQAVEQEVRISTLFSLKH